MMLSTQSGYGLLRLSTVVAAIMLASFSFAAMMTVDGWYDPTEGYTYGQYIDFKLDGSGEIIRDSELWWHEDAAGDVYVAFFEPLRVCNNTYGANTVDWGTSTHDFKQLVGSDKAQFLFTNSNGDIVLDLTLDYLYETGKGTGVYDSGMGGKETAVGVGDASWVLDAATSLDYNLNDLGHYLTVDSPETVGDDSTTNPNAYDTVNPTYSDWVFEIMYEMKISSSAFGASGFSGVSIGGIHNSPSTDGQYIPNGPVPEPSTLVLFAIGGVGLIMRRRRNKEQTDEE